MNIFKKIIIIIPKTLAGITGVIQAIVKFIKEILTLIVDILYPIIPNKKFQKIIDGIREIMNLIDNLFEKAKDFFLTLE